MSELAKRNHSRLQQLIAYRQNRLAARAVQIPPSYGAYPLPALKARIADALSARWGQGRLEPQFDMIERAKFGGDMAVKFPQLLQNGGPKAFIRDHLPWVVEVLTGPDFADAIAKVETKGMYVNLTLADRWLLDSAQAVADLDERFGLSDAQAARTVVVDYSSPNVAKVLHAGHIRSTIIGHVLANLHEACGADVYRINHINDFGGFGFTLEGYRRFQAHFPAGMGDNERLLEIYRIRRTLEKHTAAGTAFADLPAEDRDLIARYFPDATTPEALKAAFAAFTAASDARFAALEAGEADEVLLWERMVEWSLKDFDRFYEALGIHIDLVLGESFYFHAGEALVDAGLKAGTAVVYTRALADADLAALDAQLATESLTQAEHDSRAEAIEKDIGAVVVPLDDGERYVVRRADGRSIYATRDLGAIRVRKDVLHPTDMIYVVGQEQRVHFARLFKAAQALGLATPDAVRFHHLYFGFYVDAKTGRKLSSRDSVSNVNQLLESSVAHFRAETAKRAADRTAEELDHSARQLAVGSVVFNDLKQDVKGPVEIDTAALDATIAGFEKAGGAYLVYTACRARSILRRHGAPPPPASTIADAEIDPQEAGLLLKIQQIPERVAQAAEQANPTILVRHLLDTAAAYNSYYMRAPVIVDGVANPSRLLFTKAVQQALTNALRLCHVECPEKI